MDGIVPGAIHPPLDASSKTAEADQRMRAARFANEAVEQDAEAGQQGGPR